MQVLLGQTSEQITTIAKQTGAPSFTAKQICEWIYKKGATDIMQMSNLPLKLREKLAESYTVGRTLYSKEVISADGTRKYLFEYSGGVLVEAVLIFDGNRVTLCISTQAGCKMNCAFCATGKMGFVRNLYANEILNIYSELNNRCREINSLLKIDNIVFMGMGEPLDNYQEVKTSLDILTARWGYALSPHRITVSTCGFLPKMKEFLDNTQTDVAVSLHNAIPSERKDIMPIEKAFPIEKVVELLRQYDWKKQRRLTFEYIVFNNLNDTARHINAIARLLNGLPCRINLIPFNTVPETLFVGADKDSMQQFAAKLKSKGFNTTIRQSKGADISAACGLLSTKERN
ncbi:MAG: 23S rRNA (adenine(2503)-C(2))-methyltransferase RlmN [Bacteroidales bacterium]|nr:23S rRNA (adenine(2503)-C(2))-methyltransferase RlmN [Bacteroidales bacterium]